MRKIYLMIVAAMILQACCVYHTSETIGDKKITEVGVAFYKTSPVKQEMEEIDE